MLFQLFNGVEDRGRIIHHAKGIDSGAKLLFLESRTNVISKARPYEEHLLAWLNPKPRGVYINNSSKLHFYFFAKFNFDLFVGQW